MHHLPIIQDFDAAIDSYEKGPQAAIPRATDATIKMGNHKISCGQACYGCCYQFILATLAEGFVIARHLFRQGKFTRELAEKLVKAGGIMAKSERVAWFDTATPCTFLDMETKLCTIYEVRPHACRGYVVVSPKENCYPGAEDPNVKQLNNLPEMLIAMDGDLKFGVESGIDGADGKRSFRMPTTLPDAILIAAQALLNGKESLFNNMKQFEHIDNLSDEVPYMKEADPMDMKLGNGKSAFDPSEHTNMVRYVEHIFLEAGVDLNIVSQLMPTGIRKTEEEA